MSQQGARRANIIWMNKVALGGQSLFLPSIDQSNQRKTFDFHPFRDRRAPLVTHWTLRDKIVLAIGGALIKIDVQM
ncbi:hypothetical protein A6033_18675 [Aeromonas veronii]|nr:hypothetical protein A6033_18675 [Aeromonas veronii]